MNTSDANSVRTKRFGTLADLISTPATEVADHVAIRTVGGTRSMSYAELDAAAESAADTLRALGLRPRDTIGIAAHSSVEFVVAILGSARAELVCAPLDPSLPAHEIRLRVAQLGARLVLTDGAITTSDDYPVGTLTLDAESVTVSGIPTAGAPVSGHVDDDALVLFTAGTTGRPKMVPITDSNIVASVYGIIGNYELSSKDATLAIMPLFHGHGLFAALLSSLATGGTVTLPSGGRFSAHRFWADLHDANATWLTGVPSMFEIVLDRAPEVSSKSGTQKPMRFLRTCSAPLAEVTAKRMRDRFRAPVLQAYGMTESSHQIASQPLPIRGEVRPGSVGHATGGDEISVEKSTGELIARGPSVARGYLAAPDKTAQAWREGWFHTGDLGHVDADGNIYLTGRIKNIINRGGEKISPEHIEDVLAGYSGVEEVAAFGYPDRVLGERVGVAVSVSPDAPVPVTAEAIIEYSRTHLARFEVPDVVHIVDDLPHTAKGALDRVAITSRFTTAPPDGVVSTSSAHTKNRPE